MLPVFLTFVGGIILAVVFAIGLRAARTRTLSLFGFASVGCSLGAVGWSAAAGTSDASVRIALSTLSMAAGMAHGVVFSIVALPQARVWTRLLLVPLGMWTGTFVAMWFAVPFHGEVLRWLVILLASGTVTVWCLLPFWSRERGFIQQGERRIPTVRFACPRCGTRVDWRQGVAACTDCGLFLHIHWPADELHAAEGHPIVMKPRRSVRFDCPQCGVDGEWPCGDSACNACGLKLSMHWNVHRPL